MKTIIIKEENAERIMAAFAAAQGKATARTIDSYKELEYIIRVEIDSRLKGIAKKALEGTKVFYDFRQKFPSAYKYTPESTHFELVYKRGNWCIDADSIMRYKCPNCTRDYSYDLKLSDTAKEAVLKMYE